MFKKFYRIITPQLFQKKFELRTRRFRTKIGLSLISPSMTYFADGFGTSHFVGFLNDPKFNSAFYSATENLPLNLLDLLGPPPEYRVASPYLHLGSESGHAVRG